MPRTRKPSAPGIESPTMKTIELLIRYHIGRRTLRRWTIERGYPEGFMSGKHMVYLRTAVYAWEMIHMKHLHATPPILSEDDKAWELRRRRWLLEKEERAAGLLPQHPPPKPKRANARARV